MLLLGGLGLRGQPDYSPVMSQDVSGPRSDSSTLPVLGQPAVRERADAVRNRERVLAAAARLYAAHGPEQVSMDAIAEAAGVGKGTLYRRFADKAALAAALLDARETELQAALLSGPPPLGPGAPPADRLAAFAQAYLAYVDGHAELVELSQTASPGARLRTGVHGFWRQHCAYLLREAGAPDPEVRADCLLAGLSAEMVRHWRTDAHLDLPALSAAIERLARALCTAGGSPGGADGRDLGCVSPAPGGADVRSGGGA